MHFLVISTPRADKPSEARGNQKSWWDWLAPLEKKLDQLGAPWTPGRVPRWEP